MRHPILSQPKRIFVYIMAWLFLAMIQFVFLYTYFSSPWLALLVDILIQNSLLAFFFLGFWYEKNTASPLRSQFETFTE